MPTVHYMKRKFIKRYGLKWCIVLKGDATRRHREVTPMREDTEKSIANLNEVEQSTVAITKPPKQNEQVGIEENVQTPSKIISWINDTIHQHKITPVQEGRQSIATLNEAGRATVPLLQQNIDRQGVCGRRAPGNEDTKQTPAEIISWINDRICSSNKKSTSSAAPAVGVATTNCLKRKSNDLIWVRVGITNHPAYELQYNEVGQTSETGVDTKSAATSITWVEWASNGKREPICEDQIVKGGLQARKRQRPNYFS